MDNYQSFAYYYDSLMDEDFYQKYVDFLSPIIKDKKILELGCGTGSFAIKLSKYCESILATDISKEMIAIAKNKLELKDKLITFKLMDMCHINLSSKFDCILCLCDSLNYVTTIDEVEKTFLSVYSHLNQDGYFIFDVHSLYKVNHTFYDYKEEFEDQEAYFYWHVKKIAEGSIEHFVIIEDKEDDSRMEEKHIQTTYDPSFYCKLLEKTGFQNIQIYGEFEELKPTSERIILIARK